jgi:hypothetical protein
MEVYINAIDILGVIKNEFTLEQEYITESKKRDARAKRIIVRYPR